ncbi:hypothetical protein W97_07821 [Coniosporium apollinis CBS 100218]|uniref:Uncharacterized protein n=1 Tax=Coniosporium apollinis (strain CBS 100218) TaxID=1168221 RepID=R7Z387_CONA1|nr:uncharacterized protein W97_07821 [Coniosporium apollinis CBS 100218]EON68563.1 hypothetical protein W97_07821 [Coniosporium apollinis CBS 100218]
MVQQNGRFEQIFISLDKNDNEAQDELIGLMIMARDQGRLHYEKVVHNAARDADFLPVQQVNGSTSRLDYGVGKDASGFEQIVRDVVKSFVKDDIIDVITTVVQDHFEDLMDLPVNKPGSIIKSSQYAITVDRLGRIGRIDYFLFYYRFRSSSLSTKVEDCLVTSAVFSSVVMDDLNEDELLATVHNEYAMGLEGETCEQIKERQEKINGIFEKVFEDFKSKSARRHP